MLYQMSCDVFEIDPEQIEVQPVAQSTMVKLQREMSKAVWRPSPGRNLSFVIMHGWINIGLVHLASPVINLGERDKFLGLSPDLSRKGEQLRNYADMSVCVGIQPLSWYWNIGKLLALIAPTLGDFYKEKYDDDLVGVTTTSLYGRGTQYNRVYKFLGYTKGFGHEQYTDAEYHRMCDWLQNNGHGLTPYKSNVRFKNIEKYLRITEGNVKKTMHGKQRGIYYHEAIPASKREATIQFWYNRWGLPRYQNKKDEQAPYIDGKE